MYHSGIQLQALGVSWSALVSLPPPPPLLFGISLFRVTNLSAELNFLPVESTDRSDVGANAGKWSRVPTLFEKRKKRKDRKERGAKKPR